MSDIEAKMHQAGKRGPQRRKQLGPEGDHIVMGPEPYLCNCRHCGAFLPEVAEQVPADDLLRYLAGFVAVHHHCKPPVRVQP